MSIVRLHCKKQALNPSKPKTQRQPSECCIPIMKLVAPANPACSRVAALWRSCLSEISPRKASAENLTAYIQGSLMSSLRRGKVLIATVIAHYEDLK
jgi:hypothetical protein